MQIKKLINNKIVQAGSWYTITNFFIKGLAFITIPIFTRLLTTSDYGKVSLFNSWAGIFSIVISLSLAASITRGKYDFKNSYNDFVSSITFLLCLIFTIFILVFIIFNDWFLELTGLSQLLFWLMVFYAFFSSVKKIALAKFRVEYKYKKISIIMIINSIIGIVLSIFLITKIFADDKYLGRIFGNSSVMIVLGFLFFVYLLFSGKKLFSYKYWKYALALSLPLIIHDLSNIVNSQFDRIIIDRYIGSSSTGIYSFGYNMGMIISVLWTSSNQAFAPWFFEKMDSGEYKIIKKRGKQYRDLFTILYGLILFLSPEIIRIMASSQYWEGLTVIPWVFMGYYFLFIGSLEVKIEHYYKKTIYISIGTIMAAAVNVALNFLLVPRFGYIAAAITTTISYFALFLFHYLLTTKVIKTKIYGLKFYIKSIMYMILITLYFFAFKEFILFRIVGMVVLLILLFYFVKSFSLTKE